MIVEKITRYLVMFRFFIGDARNAVLIQTVNPGLGIGHENR